MFFLANFTHVTDQQHDSEEERRHGSFSMLVQTDSVEDAMRLFREKVIEFRNSRSFFTGKCALFISELIEFSHFPLDQVLMLNFKSFVGDPVMPFIACVVPDEQSDACTIHEWRNQTPVTDGRKDSIFIEFS